MVAVADVAIQDVAARILVAAAAVVVGVAVIDEAYCPATLKVQWHITNRCNLRCTHCYQEDFTARGLDQSGLLDIANSVLNWWVPLSENQPLHFVLTGGEPCTHPDFKALLEFLAEHPNQPRIDILSNGTLMDKAWISLFLDTKVNAVQLSIDGLQKTHDAIRGKGNFTKVVAASQRLKQAGIKTIWSFTAHQGNYHEFYEIAKLAQQSQINHVWTDRMIPDCGEEKTSPLALNREQTTDYLKILQKSAQQFGHRVSSSRALQFQAVGGVAYRCQAGDELITIMPNGDLYPCRRLPIYVGNLLETPLSVLYDSPLFQALRDFEFPQACSPCAFKRSCQGGLRCLAHVINHDMFSMDPGCTALCIK